MAFLFTECILRYVSVLPIFPVGMVDVNAHQSYKIYRRNIIIIPGLVLSVIGAARITDTAFEPGILLIPLHLNNEC